MNAHVLTQRGTCRAVLMGLICLCSKSKLASIFHALVLRFDIAMLFKSAVRTSLVHEQAQQSWAVTQHVLLLPILYRVLVIIYSVRQLYHIHV